MARPPREIFASVKRPPSPSAALFVVETAGGGGNMARGSKRDQFGDGGARRAKSLEQQRDEAGNDVSHTGLVSQQLE